MRIKFLFTGFLTLVFLFPCFLYAPKPLIGTRSKPVEPEAEETGWKKVTPTKVEKKKGFVIGKREKVEEEEEGAEEEAENSGEKKGKWGTAKNILGSKGVKKFAGKVGETGLGLLTKFTEGEIVKKQEAARLKRKLEAERLRAEEEDFREKAKYEEKKRREKEEYEEKKRREKEEHEEELRRLKEKLELERILKEEPKKEEKRPPSEKEEMKRMVEEERRELEEAKKRFEEEKRALKEMGERLAKEKKEAEEREIREKEEAEKRYQEERQRAAEKIEKEKLEAAKTLKEMEDIDKAKTQTYSDFLNENFGKVLTEKIIKNEKDANDFLTRLRSFVIINIGGEPEKDAEVELIKAYKATLDFLDVLIKAVEDGKIPALKEGDKPDGGRLKEIKDLREMASKVDIKEFIEEVENVIQLYDKKAGFTSSAEQIFFLRGVTEWVVYAAVLKKSGQFTSEVEKNFEGVLNKIPFAKDEIKKLVEELEAVVPIPPAPPAPKVEKAPGKTEEKAEKEGEVAVR